MSRKTSKKGSPRKSLWSFIFSPPVILAVIFVLTICLLIIFWPAIAGWLNQLSEEAIAGVGTAWLSLLRLTGMGIALIILALISLILIISSPTIFTHNWNYWIGAMTFAIALWGVLSFLKPDNSGIFSDASLGGEIGKTIFTNPPLTGILILIALILLGMILVAPGWCWNTIKRLFKGIIAFFSEIIEVVRESRIQKKPGPSSNKGKEVSAASPVLDQPAEAPTATDTAVMDRLRSMLIIGGWALPGVDILDKTTEAVISDEEVNKRKEIIEEALASYGVDARVVEINRGPTVTQFGVEPGWDRKFREIRERDRDGNLITRTEEVARTRVKVERISSLSNNLALALAAPSIRIEAPVPGKSVVGIEVPNTTFGSVSLRGVMESTAFQKMLAKSRLALALGKGAGGETAVADLAKMPHLLIAGATGSGKSVCLNSIICCLLMNNTPDAVKFIMIDPKRVELVNFNSIPHLISPVVVDTDKAIMALRWLNAEMDSRYKRFSAAGQRNIEGYNKNRQPADCMPYIVVVIDELADLMMAAFDEVERTLCRLAQLARATGIHLIVATQRPSVDVVTGLIKANFPTRISFALTSQVDSRTIIDSAGAEKLLGRGDMLYMPQDAPKPKRLQGTMVSDVEMERLVNFWSNQRHAEVQSIRFEEMAQAAAEGKKPPEDELLEKARQLALESREISASYLQRKLQIGFPRAARLMDKLREEGVVKEKGEGKNTISS